MGIVPLLLLLSCRRRGDVAPGTVLRLLGHPFLLCGLYLVYILLLVMHGLVLWQDPWARASALLTAIVSLTATAVMVRRGAFKPRAVIEVREDLREGAESAFSLMADGEPLVASVRIETRDEARECQAARGALPDFSRLRSLTVSLPPTPARELKLWAHRVTPDGTSEPLPGLATTQSCGAHAETRCVDLGLCRGQVLMSVPSGSWQVRITF
jgi:hypothetical protein